MKTEIVINALHYATKCLVDKINDLEIEKRVWIKQGHKDVVKKINYEIDSLKKVTIIHSEIEADFHAAQIYCAFGYSRVVGEAKPLLVKSVCSTCSNFEKPDYRPKHTKIGYCKKLKDDHFKFCKLDHKSMFEIFTQIDLENDDFEIEVSEDFGCVLHNKA
jgi:hypothetical protein